jgi:hypothetical protein
MDSAALTNAWLAAVARLQGRPDPLPKPGPAKTLSDVIERGLRSGGLADQVARQRDATAPGQVTDKRV